ncbi:MAG: hypothetical protein ACK501_17165 [Planctomycetota bacterium]|jgi:hypothetical protein
MLIGQTVFVPASGDPGAVYDGPWMPRQGNDFTCVLEVMRQSSSGWSLAVDVETKNAEDSDAAATNLGTLTVSAVGTSTQAFADCLELVRYKYSFSGNGTDRWIHFRMNPPIWQPN